MSVTTFVLNSDPKLEIPYLNNKRQLVAYVPGYENFITNTITNILNKPVWKL